MIGTFLIPTPGGGAERYYSKSGDQVIAPGAALDIPHLLSISPGNYALPATMKILVNVHLKSNAHAFNPLGVTNVDDVNVQVTNYDGANPATVDVWVCLLPPWLGLDGTGTHPRNYFGMAGIVAPGPAALGPANLSDQSPAAAPWDEPLVYGHVNVDPSLNLGDWINYVEPVVEPMVVANEGLAGQDIVTLEATMHSVQRIGPATDPLGLNCLYSVGAPVTVDGAAPLLVPHQLQVGGPGVVPDLAWTVCVGGAGIGAPLIASKYLTLTAVDAAGVTWTNENAPGGFLTVIPIFYRQWSGGRVP